MEIFLLGNGFDLHHNFPTSYYSFLQTVDFLINNYNSSFDTVAKVFGNKKLQENDKNICNAFEKHQGIYNLVVLEENAVENIIDRAKNNLWFKYLNNCVNRDIGWIDFEKEIVTVIEAFSLFLEDEDEKLYLNDNSVCFDIQFFPEDRTANYIIRNFDFFFESIQVSGMSERIKKIKDKYVVESLTNSGVYSLKKDTIIADLYSDLRGLANLLKDYLYYFVDRLSYEMKEMSILPKCASYPNASHVFSFNYTDTYEILYGKEGVLHLHGSNKHDIVLGVNPDENDEIYKIDTSFLQFKKYYQRIFYRTDYNYLNKLKSLRRTRNGGEGYTLFVIGHSLDITDEDIIKELFDLAHRIRILYHSEERIGSYIKNLVNIYGKNEFDNIRADKDLQFLSQAQIEWIYPK